MSDLVVTAIFRTRAWYRFSRNPLSVTGAAIVLAVTLLAIFAPFVTPFPEHAGPLVDFANSDRPPGAKYWFGSDGVGRDYLTRVIYGYRISLLLGVVVLGIAVPLGVGLGLLAGYYGGWTEAIIMRVTDIFLAIPALVAALAIMGFLEPTLFNAMIAVAGLWWPWHTRLAYNITRSLRTEDYVVACQVIGASNAHIILREILPNCVPSILTKMTLDMGFVILVASALSFLGLGVQPPTPDLGQMVADGAAVAGLWWPWHTRLAYNITRSLRTEDYVVACQVIGASNAHIILREILPNCVPSILTKMTLDMGFVILVASALSFLGLGVQPPTPDLGQMVADGALYLPDLWWKPVFPGLAILVIVLGFNLLGDGLRDMLDVNL